MKYFLDSAKLDEIKYAYENYEYNRTHWMYYRPDAETMREAHRKSKEYKKRLYEKGELK